MSMSQSFADDLISLIVANDIAGFRQQLAWLEDQFGINVDMVAGCNLDQVLKVAIEHGNKECIRMVVDLVVRRHSKEKIMTMAVDESIAHAITAGKLSLDWALAFAIFYNHQELFDSLLKGYLVNAANNQNAATALNQALSHGNELLSLSVINAEAYNSMIMSFFMAIFNNSKKFRITNQFLIDSLSSANSQLAPTIRKLIVSLVENAQLNISTLLVLAVQFQQRAILDILQLDLNQSKKAIAGNAISMMSECEQDNNHFKDQLIVDFLLPIFEEAVLNQPCPFEENKIKNRLTLIAILAKYRPDMLPNKIAIKFPEVNNATLVLTLEQGVIKQAECPELEHNPKLLQQLAAAMREIIGAKVLQLTQSQRKELRNYCFAEHARLRPSMLQNIKDYLGVLQLYKLSLEHNCADDIMQQQQERAAIDSLEKTMPDEFLSEFQQVKQAEQRMTINRLVDQLTATYFRLMRDGDVWGGELEIQALERQYNCKIRVFTNSYNYENDPDRDQNIIRLVHVDGQHYKFVKPGTNGTVCDVKPDGSCLFRAFLGAYHNTTEEATDAQVRSLRKEVVQQLQQCSELSQGIRQLIFLSAETAMAATNELQQTDAVAALPPGELQEQIIAFAKKFQQDKFMRAQQQQNYAKLEQELKTALGRLRSSRELPPQNLPPKVAPTEAAPKERAKIDFSTYQALLKRNPAAKTLAYLQLNFGIIKTAAEERVAMTDLAIDLAPELAEEAKNAKLIFNIDANGAITAEYHNDQNQPLPGNIGQLIEQILGKVPGLAPPAPTKKMGG